MGTHLFDELPAVLEGHRRQIGVMASLAAQQAALAGGTYLGEETPVDTGGARSNWVMTIDAPFAGVIPPYVPYPSYRTNHHEAVKTAVLRAPGRRVTPKNFKPGSFNLGSP